MNLVGTVKRAQFDKTKCREL